MENREKEPLWVERYRPKKIDDIILPQGIKKTLKGFVEDGNIPTILLQGGPGVGKTTAAIALCEELGAEWLMVNGSNEGRTIDTLRTVIVPFASTLSFDGARKYVIIDEGDFMSPSSVQPALRGIIEQYSSNCGFIITCNYANKIIEPISKSRCTVIDFRFPKEEKGQLMMDMAKRCFAILDENGIEYKKNPVAALVKEYFPDFRRIIGTLNVYAKSGVVDEGVLHNSYGEIVQKILSSMKTLDFGEVRKIIGENEIEPSGFFRAFYDAAPKFMSIVGLAQTVIHINDYTVKATQVADQEINLVAFCVEVMRDAEFL